MASTRAMATRRRWPADSTRAGKSAQARNAGPLQAGAQFRRD